MKGFILTLAAVVVAVVYVYGSPVGECPLVNDDYPTYLRDSSNCSLFYECNSGTAHILHCDDDLVFNSLLNTCDFRENVDCVDDIPEPIESRSAVGICPKQDDGDAVLLPDGTNCTIYYLCSAGVPIPNHCPAHLVFNPILRVCDYPTRRCVLKYYEEDYDEEPFDYRSAVGVCPETDPEEAILLADSRNCSVYYICNSGTPIANHCPGSLVFNPVLNVCDYPHQECYAAVSCPTMISRKQWGAREPRSISPLRVQPVPYVVIHHGATRTCNSQVECSIIVRSYQNHHMDDEGWPDISLNFIIGEDGNIYEGRGWDTSGSHATGYDVNSIGITIIGDYSERLPNEDAMKALKELISCGVSNGKIREDFQVIGHRQATPTLCPGETFFKEIQTWSRYTSKPVPAQ